MTSYPIPLTAVARAVSETPQQSEFAEQRVLTVLNTPSKIGARSEQFGSWLAETGASKVTVCNYTRAVTRWSAHLDTHPNTFPGTLWREWDAPLSIKRITGFACRRYLEFLRCTYGDAPDLGIPDRLPAASSPNPQPVTDDHLRRLLLEAKVSLPKETGYSVRVWLSFVEETGCRRSESQIAWGQLDWEEGAVTLVGKTGERQIPLGKSLRRLKWLRRRKPASPWCGARNQVLSVGVLYNIFNRLAAAIGSPVLRPHFLRHRRLTILCRTDLGKNPLLVLSWAGQAHISALAPYYRVSLAEKRAMLAAA